MPINALNLVLIEKQKKFEARLLSVIFCTCEIHCAPLYCVWQSAHIRSYLFQMGLNHNGHHQIVLEKRDNGFQWHLRDFVSNKSSHKIGRNSVHEILPIKAENLKRQNLLKFRQKRVFHAQYAIKMLTAKSA